VKDQKPSIVKKAFSILFFIVGILVSPIIFSVNFGFASSWWTTLLCLLLSFSLTKAEFGPVLKKKYWLPVVISFVVFVMIRGLWMEHTALHTRLSRAFAVEELSDVTVLIDIIPHDDRDDFVNINLRSIGEAEDEVSIYHLVEEYSILLTEILTAYEVTNWRLHIFVESKSIYYLDWVLCSDDAFRNERGCFGWHNPSIFSGPLRRYLDNTVWLHYENLEYLLMINSILDSFVETLYSNELVSVVRLEILPGLEEFILRLSLDENVDYTIFERAIIPVVDLLNEHALHILDFRWIMIRSYEHALENGTIYRLFYVIHESHEPGALRLEFKSDRRISGPLFEWDVYRDISFDDVPEIIYQRE